MTTKTAAQADYTLFLDKSRTARAFDPEESLWTPELTQLFELIGGQLDALDTAGEDEVPPLLSIAIFGTHGSGKTSLLYTLKDRLERPHVILKQKERSRYPEERKKLVRRFEILRNRVACLDVLKPNLLAEGQESFLYSLLAAAVEAEQEQHRHQEQKSWESQRSRQGGSEAAKAYATDRFLTPVQRAFQEVSEYLQVIDQADRRSSEHDPLGVSLERLERHTSDLRLREQMGRLLDVLADQLTGRSRDSLILMPVDDADMSKGSITSILDTYRRYLLHPRLVPVFTFTGRLSEELLTAHFSDRLAGEEGRIREIADRRVFEEQIAFQYLARLFPVRNRIRLGATTVRVQEAAYRVRRRVRSPHPEERGSSHTEPRWVVDLLQKGSELLFGHPRWLVEPRVDLPLRPSRLRRQLQILDALHAVGVTDLVREREGRSRGSSEAEDGRDEKEALRELQASSRRWVEIFDKGAWAILDIHRDALKEVNIYLDELYGEVPRSLREWLLSRLLDLSLEKRQTLLQRWRYRTENRRGQVLSLLIANSFRPALQAREEIPGQAPLTVLEEGRDKKGQESSQVERQEGAEGYLTPVKGLLWFLNLWIGFYLPMIVARNREVRERNSSREGREFTQGIGWHLDGGAAQAAREALASDEVYSTGMMLVGGKKVNELLNAVKDQDFEVRLNKSKSVDDNTEEVDKLKEKLKNWDGGRTSIIILIWCFFGHDSHGKPWAIVSLWRGLSLIGKLLQAQEQFQVDSDDQGTGEKNREEKENAVKALLKNHFESAWLPASYRPGRDDDGASSEDQKFPNPLANWDVEGDDIERPAPDIEYFASTLVEKVIEWMEKFDKPNLVLDPLNARRTLDNYLHLHQGTNGSGSHSISNAEYEKCFLRRLHGDDLLGTLWPQLEKVYPGVREAQIDASNLMKEWVEVLFNYWQYEPLLDLLAECPFLAPFCVSKDLPKRYRTQGRFLGGSFKTKAFGSLKPDEKADDNGDPGGSNGSENNAKNDDQDD